MCVAVFPPPQCAFGVSCRGCLGRCLCAPVLASLVRARGLAFRLGVCLLGFPAVVYAVKPFPTVASLCNTQLAGHSNEHYFVAMFRNRTTRWDVLWGWPAPN